MALGRLKNILRPVMGDVGSVVVASADINFRKDIEAGIGFESLLTAVVAEESGIAVDQVATLRAVEDCGVSVEQRATGTSKSTQEAGIEQLSVLTMNNLPEGIQGFEQQQTWDYTGTRYIGTASNIGADNWTNVTNAQGDPASAGNATRSGQLLASTDAQIRGIVNDINTSKDVLNIDLVEIRYYVQQSGTTLNNGGLELDWRLGTSGGWTNLATYTNDQNFLTTPDAHVITGSISSWTNIRDVEVRVRFNVGTATNLVNAACDAVELHVEASLVE